MIFENPSFVGFWYIVWRDGAADGLCDIGQKNGP